MRKNMEELVKFYETVLIPHLKIKYGELMVLAAEMEATIVFKENKINKLEDKLNLLNSKGADGLQDELTNIKKNVNKKKM
jgi:hypothetical protein